MVQGMCGVVCDTVCDVNVSDGRKRDPRDLLSCPHYPLQALIIRGSGVSEPDSDAAAEDALYSPSVKCGEYVGWDMNFPQSS